MSVIIECQERHQAKQMPCGTLQCRHLIFWLPITWDYDAVFGICLFCFQTIENNSVSYASMGPNNNQQCQTNILQKTRLIPPIMFFVAGVFATPAFAEGFSYKFEIDGSKVCNDNHKTLLKSSDKTKYVCVKETTHEKLVDRGYGFDSFSMNLSYHEPALSTESDDPTIITMKKPELPKLPIMHTILLDEKIAKGETALEIIEHLHGFDQRLEQIMHIDYQGIPDPAFPYLPKISDDQSKVFLEDHVCSRLLLLDDRARAYDWHASFFSLLSEGLTVNQAIGFNPWHIEDKNGYYDDYCVYELEPGEDPKKYKNACQTISNQMTGWVKFMNTEIH